ncbi:MAG TPA: DNA alkylation repair protein [Gryllotalpicola sp.]
MGAMNELLNTAVIHDLADRARRQGRDGAADALAAIDEHLLAPLSLRERVDLVAGRLVAHTTDFDETARMAHGLLDDPGYEGWAIWPVGEAAVTRALEDGSPAELDAALELLRRLTSRLTAEFPIRRLLEADLDRSIAAALGWTADGNEHVRRLASEGTRAYLPWAIRVRALLARPGVTVPILDRLYRDPSDYVRRSVGNHLNDLSRDAPELVVATAARWMSAPDRNTASVVRRGLRTLVKRAHPGALALLGVRAVEFTVGSIRLAADDVLLPGELAFTADIGNPTEQDAMAVVDYVIHYRKADGRLAPKVFKLLTGQIPAGGRITVSKTHTLRQMTTRVHYPGEHAIELQVNGIRHGYTVFTLSDVAHDAPSTS